MRVECKNYESRTYASGETVRQCRLDLAPEAPWRCPADCPKFELRRGDVAWNHGSLVSAKAESPPEPPRLDEHTAALLDAAEDIVNAVGPSILAEVEEERARVAKQQRQAGAKRSFGGRFPQAPTSFFRRLFRRS